jgi:hypothetical protein
MDVYSSRNVENELELCRTDGTGTYTFAVTAQEWFSGTLGTCK